ncbi:Xaa-Pro peptidase family protein [Paracoccaceae bacterium]|nr:Xaa-Pro peptidase family protein [Paracoccaceae bacterium]
MKVFENRLAKLKNKLLESDIDTAIITDEDNVYYLCGYYDYLHMEFGRPTLLVISIDCGTLLITPTIDLNTAEETACVDRISAWNDGMGNEWKEELPEVLKRSKRLAIEPDQMPPIVRKYIDEEVSYDRITSATPILSTMRMIKSEEELKIARDAGKVATAMMVAGREAIGHGVAEYEVAIATSNAGTKKAAEILKSDYEDKFMSPNTHFLQIMASGETIIKTHHRASTRIMQTGEPVFLCFCGMTNFHKFKLGFDRTFWIDRISDKSQIEIYEVAIASQKAALNVLKPGVTAESVHAAYASVIQDAGFDYPFRCGRATGFSFLEKPQLVTGDKTILEPGMVFAVDGSVSGETFRAQVGDSVIITETGWEPLTAHPKSINDVIIC